ncbi:MAG: hypothetical protein SH856_04290 [Flavobacteriales bacterium]|nr:hypothetical protein [Flavobacteriales bacterium]
MEKQKAMNNMQLAKGKGHYSSRLKSFFIGVLIAVSSQVSAQIDTLTSNYTFTGDLELKLRDANKLPVNAQLYEDSVKMMKIQYSLLPTRKNFNIEVKPITPAKINFEDKLQKLYRGYIKAGYGLWFTPLVDMYYTDGRSRKGAFGFSYNHLSSAGGVAVDDSIPDHFSDNRFDFWGKYFFKKTAFGGGVNWERNLTNWYGFNPELIDSAGISLPGLKQRLNTLGGNLTYHTYGRDSVGMNYKAEIAIRNTSDFLSGKETNVDLNVGVSELVETELYKVQFGVNYNQFLNFEPALFDTMEHTEDNAIIKLVPTAFTVWNDLRVTAGLGFYLQARGEVPLHFYPIAELRYNILKGLLVPYAGVRGSLNQTTYLGLYRENPFIVNYPDLVNVNNKLELYGGISGSASASSSFNAGVNHTQYENFNYFINDSVWRPGNQMQVVYDNLTALNLYGEFSLKAPEKWTAYLRGDYFMYSDFGNQEHPWHQPNLKITATAEYNLKDKFILQTEIIYVGERWAKSLFPVEGITPLADGSTQFKLDGFVDANFKIEYRYNKRLSGWVLLNNIATVKYQRWSGYRVQRPGALLGITYAF